MLLKDKLARERGIRFAVPDIDGHLEFKAGRRKTSPLLYHDMDRDQFAADGLRVNGLIGEIATIPVHDPSSQRTLSLAIEIIYLKLGLDRGRIKQHERIVEGNYGLSFWNPEFSAGDRILQCHHKGSLQERCPFPQESTFKQFFTMWESWGYVSLGKHLTGSIPKNKH